MNENKYGIHTVGIFALFLLGEAGILIPFYNSNEKTFLSFLIAVAAALMLIIGISIAFKFLSHYISINSFFEKILYSAVIIYCAYIAVECFNTFLEFASAFILPGASKLLIGFVFTFVIIFASLCPVASFLKLGFILFVFSVAMLFVLFLFSVPQFSKDNIILLSFPDFSDVLKQSFDILKKIFLPFVVTPFFCLSCKQSRKPKYLIGFFIGAVMLACCFLNSLLIFGAPLSARLEFPYSEAIATVTVGNIFTRMDGFSYFVFFSSSFVKITLCAKVSLELIKKIGSIINVGVTK